MRSFVYHANDDENYAEEVSDNRWEMMDKLNGLIIGGSDVWQKKMQELLPSWKFISPSLNSIERKMIANAEYVFVNTSYIGHSMYYGVISIVQASDRIKLGFINSRNPDRGYSEMRHS